MTPTLDVRTLLLIVFLSYILHAVCMQYVRWVHADFPATRLWANGALLLALGVILLSLRGAGAPPLVTIVLANSLIFGGQVLTGFGVALAAGRTPPWRWGMFSMLVFCALFIWAITGGQAVVTVSHRVVMFTVFSLLIQAYVAGVCATARRDAMRASFYALGLFNCLLIVLLLVRLVAALRHGIDDVFQNTFEQIWLYIGNISVIFFNSVAYAVIAGQRLQMELRHLATHDPLTLALNRREFGNLVERDWARAIRHRRPMTALMIDVDHFKRINDEYGHQAGDAVLVQVVKEMRGLLRQTDTLARYGGEEFAIMLIETNQVQALEVAERIRAKIAAAQFPAMGTGRIVTVSIGLAGYSAEADWESLLHLADRALYRAKQEGRNRVCVG